MSLPSLPTTTTGSHSYIPYIANICASAFSNDALIRSSILHQDRIYGTTNSIIPPERCLKFWMDILPPKVEGGGIIVEAGDWAAAALWFPPNIKKPHLGSPDELSIIQKEYSEKFDAIKERYLQGRPHWYLNIIGRHPERMEPGVVRALIDTYLQKAKADGVPAFLEASSAHARDVYAHLGFRIVEEVSVGVGHMDVKGNLVEDGEGMRLWGMIVEPEDGEVVQ